MAQRQRRAANSARTAEQRVQHLLWLSLAVLVVKLVIIAGTGTGAWLGADGENYTSQVQLIWKNGLFTSGLDYWPAGYALTLWVLSFAGHAAMPWVLSIVQTVAWSAAVWLLAREVLHTRVTWVALPAAYLALLNPTLTLTSITIGYESLAGAAQMVGVALLLRDLRVQPTDRRWLYPVLAGAVLGYSLALQPRLAIGALLIFAIWWHARRAEPGFIRPIAAGLVVMALFPLALVARNELAIGRPVLSSNLGVNMMMGVGSDSTATYGSESKAVQCSTLPTDPISADNAKVACALSWYLHNPGPTLVLAWKKSVNLWSSWWGPLARGTMARNPYLAFHPIRSITTTQSMLDLVLGPAGQTVEWLWLLGGWFALAVGFWALWRLGGTERALGSAALAVILGSWAVTIGTFGDHRFRLPFMGLSLLLQAVGWGAVFMRGRVPGLVEPLWGRRSATATTTGVQVGTSSSPAPKAGAQLSKSARRKRR